jgi:hypothetical protein
MEKRNYLGSEISKTQCEYAQKRIDIMLKQQKLF